MFRVLIAAICTMGSFCQLVSAGEKMAVMPFGTSGVDDATQQTVYRLLVSEITQLGEYEVIPESEVTTVLGDQSCLDAACATEIGKQLNASRVVFGTLNRLGEKIILQYNVVKVSSGETLLSDDLTAMHVEDLDQVTKRVAASIVRQAPVEETVEVGLVTEQESTETRSRKANASWGIGFGYLYPTKGYDEKDDVFVFDFRSIYEMRHIAVDALLGIRQGLSLNVGVLYLPSLKDFCPYVGAGVGFHAVAHNQDKYSPPDSEQNKKSSDGFEILVKGGLLAFRTYDFRVLLNLEYSVTLNDYDDQAIIFTIGVMRSGKRVFGIF